MQQQWVNVEAASFPIFINYYVKVIKYWTSLLQMDEDRLPRACYKMLYQADVNGKQNWVAHWKIFCLDMGLALYTYHKKYGISNC